MDNFDESTSREQFPEVKKTLFTNRKILFVLLFLFVLADFGYFFFGTAPGDFPVGASIEVPQGASLRSVSLDLKNQHIIRSRLAFEGFVILYGAEGRLVAGSYRFGDRVGVWSVASRISGGGRFSAPVVVTIPEGFNINEIADTFSKKLKNFSKERFLIAAKSKEGYLFPDTYYFFTADSETDVLDAMTKNFEKKVAPLRPEIQSSGKTEEEIIVMASLVEGESKGNGDRERIAGILWKRLALGMRLQVDAAPVTYKASGLPKAPIANPGLAAIKAALHPESSSYLYYLHDKDGTIHYAKSFEEHKGNIKKYLK